MLRKLSPAEEGRAKPRPAVNRPNSDKWPYMGKFVLWLPRSNDETQKPLLSNKLKYASQYLMTANRNSLVSLF